MLSEDSQLLRALSLASSGLRSPQHEALEALPVPVDLDAPQLQEGLGAPDNASFAAWVATNDIVRSQIDERILRAAEQGLPFKGGDL